MILLLAAPLAAAAVLVTAVLAGRDADRAAIATVLAAAAGGAAALVLLVPIGLVGGQRQPGFHIVGVEEPEVVYEPARVAAGLGGAVVLLAISGWLVRTGDWGRPDE